MFDTALLEQLTSAFHALHEVDTRAAAGCRHDAIIPVADLVGFFVFDDSPLNFAFESTAPSQSLPKVQHVTFAAAIGELVELRDSGRFGVCPLFASHTEEQVYEIDSAVQFQIAQFIYRNAHGLGVIPQWPV